MDKKIKPIDSLRNAFKNDTKKEKRLTLNEMIYNDEYEEYEDGPGYENVPDIGGENTEETMSGGKPIDRALPSEQNEDPELMEIFANIRHAVLVGLQKLERKPYTVEFDTLSKILQIVNKPIKPENSEK